MRLSELGWTEARAREFDAFRGNRPDLYPGRVGVAFNHLFRCYVEGGEWEASIAGRLKHRASRQAELPVVGDWVVLRRQGDQAHAALTDVLPRSGCFSRKEAGETTDEQVVAANIDVVFVVTALDADFSPRRIERYLLLAREGGARPVVLLTKPDLCADLPQALAAVAEVARSTPVHVVAPRSGEGMARVQDYLAPGITCALLGSSGVGKSTIVNRLVGRDVQRTQAVRDRDAKGRHTTTHRELVPIPGGGILVDTPGMREIQLWEARDAVEQTFEDIEALAAACRFGDCRHREEPRCAVKGAVETGALAAERLASYLALREEMDALAARQDVRARLEDKRLAKVAGKALAQRLRQKGR